MQAATVEKQNEIGFKSDSFEKNGYHEENINLNMFEDYNEDSDEEDEDDEHYSNQFQGIPLNNNFNQPQRKSKKSKVKAYERT